MIFTFEGGKVIEKERFLEFIQKAKGKYKITEYKATRTNEQNRYYRLLLGIIEKETGNHKDDSHRQFGMAFLVDRSRKLPLIKSTTELTTKEFTDYIEKIKDYMAVYGLILPEVNQVL